MYLQQSFRGKNSFGLYFLTTIVIIFSQFIGGIPLLIWQNSDNSNIRLMLLLAPFAVGCLFLWFCIKYIHRKKFKDVVTSRKRFDFKRAAVGGLIWGGLLIIGSLPMLIGSDSSLQLNFQPEAFIGLIIICLIFMPFQTSFEELLFRGYYMQGTTVTVKNKWLPLIITSVIFGLMHSANPEVINYGFWIAMPNYIIMGFILGIAAIMDEGLEIPLGIHFVNNFLSAILVTDKNSVFQTPSLFVDTNPEMHFTDSLIILGTGIIFLFICYKRFKWNSFKTIFQKVKPTE